MRTPVTRAAVEQHGGMLRHAEAYVTRGWAPIPVPYGVKGATIAGWPDLRLGLDDLPQYFNNDQPSNIGVLLGEPSGGLVDVDLDCPSAVQLAPIFLPPTEAIFGRASKRRSHRLYIVGGSLATKQYRDPAGTMLVELRSTGVQTLFPGSTHPSGEPIEWDADGDPARVESDVLRQAVVKLAVAALLARHWPLLGSRHDAALAASGFLMREGLDEATTSTIVQAAAQAAGDEESVERMGDTATTANRLDGGAPATGGPRLAELLSGDAPRVVAQLRRWLRMLPCQPRTVGTNGRGPAQAQLLADLADDVELFRATGTDVAYATVPIGERRATWPVRSRGFRNWIVKRFFDAHGKPPGAQALADALGVLEARAQFEGLSHAVALRVAGSDGAIYLDLADDAWQAVEITCDGWRVVTVPPLKFRRSRGMLSLPVPERGGSITELRPFINIANEDQWTLFVASLCMKFRPTGPYPIDQITGEAGSAKSTLGRTVKRLIDPNAAPLRAEPRDERDLMIAASNNWLLAYDNLSHLLPWMSDALCRLATGGGFATRQLYTDDDEVLFDAQRPVMLNGIEDIGTRSDLADRTLRFTLPAIPDRKRKAEDEFWAAFDAARPRLLGALLDAVSGALRHLPDVHLKVRPRMADFAVWGAAVERALGWKRGRFVRAYTGNRESGHEAAIDAAVIGTPLRAAVGMRTGGWSGTSGELLELLTRWVDEDTRRSKFWPKTARALSGALRRLAPSLRAIGWVVVLPEAKKNREPGTGRRLITLRQPQNTGPGHRHNRHDGHDRHDQPGGADGQPSRSATEMAPESARQPIRRDGCDGRDGASPHPSGRPGRTPVQMEAAAWP